MGLMCILAPSTGCTSRRTPSTSPPGSTWPVRSGAIFAGDFLTLFLFWEMMAFSSVFLIWFRGRPRIPRRRVTAICWFMSPAAWRCWPGWSSTARPRAVGLRRIRRAPSRRSPIYLILAGFILNAAVPPLHAWLPDAYGEATFNGSVFLCAFTTKTAVYALCRGFAGMEILVAARRHHGPLRRGLCRAGERLPPPARLPHHQPGRLHGRRASASAPRWRSTAPAPTPSPTSSTRACSSWAAARSCT